MDKQWELLQGKVLIVDLMASHLPHEVDGAKKHSLQLLCNTLFPGGLSSMPEFWCDSYTIIKSTHCLNSTTVHLKPFL